MKNPFTTNRTFDYFNTALAKSSAERRNSNNKLMAHNTPKACFLLRKIRTPQERPESPELQERLSMVTCDGQPLAVGCVPLVAVFYPVARYRPVVESKAVTLKFTNGVTAMIYLFAGIKRLDRTNQIHSLRIEADSERQARAILARDYVLAFAGRINRTFTAAEVHGVIYA